MGKERGRSSPPGGDLIASGTVSGVAKDSLGCLIELTERGANPIQLPTGEVRRFLQDGDEVMEIVKVKRRGKRIKEGPPRYFVVWPVYSEVAVDQERSGFQWEEPPKCGVCREGHFRGYARVVLEGEPRENVFMPRRLGVVLADERFKEFCDRHGITNCLLIPAEEASYWPSGKGSADR